MNTRQQLTNAERLWNLIIRADFQPDDLVNLLAARCQEAHLVPPDDLMLAASSVDMIFLCDTYHHINDRVAYFAKARQSLKPGGRLVILDFVRTKENSDHSIVKEEIVDGLRRAGFRLAKEFDLLLPKKYFLEFEPALVQKTND